MISELTGQVRSAGPDAVVLLVGGVGLQVHCSPNTLAGLRVGQTATLSTALIVREDSLTLYGFPDEDARSVFEALQTATGVGPRLAQAVLGVLAPDDVRRAIAEEDLVALCRVPGVGRKVAQRLVLELKDRLGPPEGPATRVIRLDPGREEAHAALLSLGYSGREADAALLSVLEPPDPQVPADAPAAAVLRAALASLRRG